MPQKEINENFQFIDFILQDTCKSPTVNIYNKFDTRNRASTKVAKTFQYLLLFYLQEVCYG